MEKDLLSDLKLKYIDEILGYVKKENENQIEKFGEQSHNFAEWNMILAEEVGELTKEMLEMHFGKAGEIEEHYKSAFTEAIQVSTLALKIAEMLNNLIKEEEYKNQIEREMVKEYEKQATEEYQRELKKKEYMDEMERGFEEAEKRRRRLRDNDGYYDWNN